MPDAVFSTSTGVLIGAGIRKGVLDV